MFDIGFSELLLIALVALLVMGPERLPETVRSIALWIGRLKQMLANARKDLEQEVGMDDIRHQLHNEKIMRDLNDSKESVADTLKAAATNPLEKSILEPHGAKPDANTKASDVNSIQNDDEKDKKVDRND